MKCNKILNPNFSGKFMDLLLILVALFTLLTFGMPVGFAMGVSGAIGLYIVGGAQVMSGILTPVPYDTVASYELISVPMFVLMAEFIIVSKIAEELYDCLVVWVGRLPGGLAVATALAGAGFGAISGSSTVSAATLASTSLPSMVKHGYDKNLANGVVAVSGTLSMLIPPSVALIIYSILTDQSVAKLLIAGVIPGLIIAGGIIATILILVSTNPKAAPQGVRFPFSEKCKSAKKIAPMVVLITLVTASIYTGLTTPTESAAVGAFGAALIALYRGMKTAEAYKAVINAVRTTAMIMTILIGAHIFGYALTFTEVPQKVVEFVATLDTAPVVTMACILGVLLILGFFMDQLAIMLLAVPILTGVVESLGYDLIWFGIMFVIVAEVGMISPPVGMNVFVISKYTNQPAEQVFNGVYPHIFAHLLLIALFLMFPAIILWLPSTM